MLGNNQLTNIDYLAHSPLPFLTELSLFKNEIEEWPVSGLSFPFLRHLLLYDNKLATFTLSGWCPCLQLLNLSENLLFAIHGLHNAPALEVLDLSFNKFQSPSELIENVLWLKNSLRKLKVNDTPFWRDAAQPG